MRIKRGLRFGAAAVVITPLALGVGVIVFLASTEEDEASGPEFTTGALRIGQEAVPPQYAGLISEAAEECDAGLPAPVLAAQLMQESQFNPRAESPEVGAQGIAQFMPATWKSSGVDGNGDGEKNVWDPEDAIPAQGKMMCGLLKTAKKHPEYNGSPIELALAGYNAGWGRVIEYSGVPPRTFAQGQTYDYVKIIMANVDKLTTVDTVAADTPGNAPAKIRKAISWALEQKGGWYHLGGDCTNAHGKDQRFWCDCSSLMQQAYKAAGITIPRTTFDQEDIGREVDIDHPKPGDLVFNPGSDGSDAEPGHVGMYIGDGKIIEAPRTGVRTRIVTYESWRNSTSNMTRISKVIRVVDW
ncbi:NlpC/P60 family protein [Streptomyces sp. NPDC059679]|uniref:C40 family peptidase n=1 Tax=Streptomyces sp. NPDC059679 TaxID=3346903 RepID=UPI00369F9232